ncbi:MAG: PEP-CTERM sorting domain-containing protein, partial [Deltaproteobacteria bacterium]|nr:PEP-CTERM sorting domain-containing protein [Deltaproteobacteria bacterium]
AVPLPSSALGLPGDGTKTWIQSNAVAPAEFKQMTLWWFMTDWPDDAVINYDLYYPENVSGPQQYDPFAMDLSSLWGENVIFSFYATGTATDPIILGELDTDGNLFYFDFFDEFGDPLAYLENDGTSATAPAHGDLLFHYDAADQGGYNPFIDGWLTQSDFVHAPVPVPGALLLLGSGLIGLAGIRKKLKK